ncbi:cAMP-dependent protein kinase catalytic subunit alpha-like [Varroa jacobsoni]|uniref:non-specific serine/threonine protein kinase n=1 Tax=Varroa destructor TaxID=109461 RepID=A0A7M7K8F7_VARDE|nr:cAMP-dependent protein kinase catalytic subunit alpha-like [Varroa destructor]XP_022710500.1 cAMP-dependent protein kinase catalytic subunit alpha-like [Varroa jacobsoni]
MGCKQSLRANSVTWVDAVIQDAEKYRTFLSAKVAALQAHLKDPQIPFASLDHFKVISYLGAGSFSSVLEVQHKDNSTRYAIKIIRKDQITTQPGLAEQVLNEKNVHAALDFEFIIKLYFAFKDNTCLYFVLEFATCGNLYDLLKRRRLNEDEARFYVAQLILALEYIHAADIIYRDLKPDNVLVNYDGYLKLADFGLARRLDEKKKAYSLCGTAEYIAPEVATTDGYRGYGLGADWWSLGILVHFLVFRKTPFVACSPAETINAVIQNKFRIRKIAKLSKKIETFLYEILEKQPEDRLGVKGKGVLSLKNHSWLRGYEWMTLYKKRVIPPEPNPQPQWVRNIDWKPEFSSKILYEKEFEHF